VELEAQLPNERGALVDRDPVPEQSICIRLRFLLPQPKDPHFGTGPCRLPTFRIEGVSAHRAKDTTALDRETRPTVSAGLRRSSAVPVQLVDPLPNSATGHDVVVAVGEEVEGPSVVAGEREAAER